MNIKNLIPITATLILLIISYFLPPYLTESLGLLLIILITLKMGRKKGIITALGVSLVMFTGKYIFNNQIGITMLISSTIFNFSTVFIICRTIYIFREKNKQLKATKRKLKAKNSLLQSILDNAPIGIWFVDQDQKPILVNKTFKENTGFGTEGTISMTEKELQMCKRTDHKTLNENDPKRFEEEVTFKDGKKHILETIKNTVYYEDGDVLGILGIGVDITKRKEREEKIKYLSFHDQLTGLYNRRYFENEIKRLNKSRRLPISIIVADMDGLKYINDKYGHKRGDQYLKIAAKIFKKVVRSEDILARIGGDEFSIILPETDLKTCHKIGDRIKSKLEKYNKKDELSEPIEFSLGFACKTTREENLDEIFNKADQKMYENKGRRRKKLID